MSAKVIITILDPVETKRKPRRKGIVDNRMFPDLLARRQFAKDWEFFNLATRLQTPGSFSDYSNYVEPDDQEPPVVNDDSKLEYLEMGFDAEAVFEDILSAPDVPEGQEDVYKYSSNHLQVKINDTDGEDLLRTWDDYLLGIGSAMDPFISARHENWENMTAEEWRWIPHCKPIWFGYADQETEEDDYENVGTPPSWNPEVFEILIKSKLAGSHPPETSYITNNAKVREVMADFVDIHAKIEADPFLLPIWEAMDIREYPEWVDKLDEAKDSEEWNPINLIQASVPINNRGVLEKLTNVERLAADGTAGAAESIHIKLDSKMVWEPFDTSDTTNYKITIEPDYAADDAIEEFNISQAMPIKFYLKPQWLGWFRDAGFHYSRTIYQESYRARRVIPDELLEEYEEEFPEGLTPYHNVQVGFVYTVYYVGIPIAVFDFQPKDAWVTGFNFDYPVWDTLASFSVDVSGTGTDGQYSVSGLPEGQFFSGVGVYEDLGGGNYQYVAFHEDTNWTLTLTYKFIGQDAGNRTSTVNNIHLDKAWIVGGGEFNSGMIRIYRGAHVGIWPFIPHAIGQNWRSGLTALGSTNYTQVYDGGIYADPLGEKDYVRETVKDFPGRVHQFGVGGTFSGTVHPIYTKHTSRDTKDFIWLNQPAPLSVPSEVGQDRVIATQTYALTWKDQQDANAGHLVWIPQYDDMLEAASVEFNALPHIREHGYPNPATVYYSSAPSFIVPFLQSPNIRCVPLDGYVGALCAVLDTPNQRYFIWRKTAEDRGGFDYNRNQAHTPVQFIAMP